MPIAKKEGPVSGTFFFDVVRVYYHQSTINSLS